MNNTIADIEFEVKRSLLMVPVFFLLIILFCIMAIPIICMLAIMAIFFELYLCYLGVVKYLTILTVVVIGAGTFRDAYQCLGNEWLQEKINELCKE